VQVQLEYNTKKNDTNKYKELLKMRYDEVKDENLQQNRYHKIIYNEDWKYKLPKKYLSLSLKVQKLYNYLENNKLKI
jgi:hypothetical protein